MLVVVTGIDGSGTSTIAEKLHEMDPDSYILRTPSNDFMDRGHIDDVIRKESGVAHMLCYLSSVVYLSDYIRNHCDYKEKNVYVVRYLIDTVVSNRAAGIPINLNYNVYGNNLLVPDLTLFVGISEEERQRRLAVRGKDSLDCVLDDSSKRRKFIDEYGKLLIPEKTIYVDNNGNIDDVVNNTYQKIKAYQKSISKLGTVGVQKSKKYQIIDGFSACNM